MSNSRIDDAILSVAGERWKKVARAIVEVAKLTSSEIPSGDEGLEVISQHIEVLVRSGRLAAQGNTRNWRFSEVRLPGDSQIVGESKSG
jgi:hypothetical protein